MVQLLYAGSKSFDHLRGLIRALLRLPNALPTFVYKVKDCTVRGVLLSPDSRAQQFDFHFLESKLSGELEKSEI